MGIPVGRPLSIPAQVVATDRLPPAVLAGTVTRFDGSVLSLGLTAGAEALEPGDALVLDLQRPSAPLVQGRVIAVEGTTVLVRVERSRPREPREFPRVAGALEVRYRPVPAEATESDLEGWVEGGRGLEGDASWRRPARLVDWSAAGLGFEDEPVCRRGDRILLELSPAGEEGPAWAVGHVVRVLPIPDDEDRARPEASHRVAVDFERIAPRVREILLAHTIERQRLPGEDRDVGDAP